ncbi:MAG TPA: hypothetical protein PLS59_07730 [Kiritimatiellia bacterium]|nr:hypothetical protein [Kiritimatiellia bacterium]
MQDAAMTLSLFSITVHADRKAPLLSALTAGMEKSAILQEIVETEPIVEIRKGSVWRIRNLKKLDNDLYFRLGRTMKRRLPTTDVEGDFTEEDFPHAPNTHVYLAVDIQVCAIAHKTELAPYPESIASALVSVLSGSPKARELCVTFKASPVQDAKPFLERLKGAYQVSRLWVETSRPNPFDFEEDFVKPISRSLELVEGEKVRTEWVGKNLAVSSEEVEEIVRSVTARGGHCGATIKDQERTRSRRIKVQVGSVKITADLSSPISAARDLLSQVRGIFKTVRQGTSADDKNG